MVQCCYLQVHARDRHRSWLPVHDDLVDFPLPAMVLPATGLRPAAPVQHAKLESSLSGR